MPEDVEAGEAGAESGGEEEIIGERCGGDAAVVGVEGDAEAGAEVIEQRVAHGGVGRGVVERVAFHLEIGVRAHLQSDATIGDRAPEIV